jgi:streptogramin lyase
VITIAVVGAVIAVIAGVAGVLELIRSPNAPVSGLLYSRQTVLPFTGLKDPTGVAVDAEGNVYVTDAGNRRVLKLAAGSGSQTVLPFTGLQNLTGVAVHDKGTVYVSYFTDGFPRVGKVVKLAAGSNSQTALPFTDLADPRAVAVDPGGSVYVADRRKHQVVRLGASPTRCAHGAEIAAELAVLVLRSRCGGAHRNL